MCGYNVIRKVVKTLTVTGPSTNGDLLGQHGGLSSLHIFMNATAAIHGLDVRRRMDGWWRTSERDLE